MLGKGSNWKETHESAIELEINEDEVKAAVEAMLRHVYGFKYSAIKGALNSKNSLVSFDVGVIIVAKTYLLKALRGAGDCRLTSRCQDSRSGLQQESGGCSCS